MRTTGKTKKFFTSKATFTGVFILGVTILVALFAYPLATDKTPDANTIIVELSAKPAGFSKQLLLVPKATAPAHVSSWQAFWSGTPSGYTYVPADSIAILSDTVMIRHYIDDNVSEILTYPLKETWGPGYDAGNFPFVTERTFHLGTDRYGRDIYSRLLLGARVSLAVGLISVTLSLSLGILLGALAGWYGGWTDKIIMWFVNLLWAVPTLLLVFAVTLTIGKGFWEIFIAIGLTSWIGSARLIRGQVMQLKNLDYITAARLLGYSDIRIIARHILPNIAGPILVTAAANFASAILVEAGLSFLGFGVQPPTPSWGLMIKEHYNFLVTDNPLPALIPGLAIFLLVLAFNIIGNGLRDILDVKTMKK